MALIVVRLCVRKTIGIIARVNKLRIMAGRGETMVEKRLAGQIVDDVKNLGHKIWLVLSESSGKEGVGFKHKCGAEIKGKLVTSSVWDGLFPCSGGS